MRISKRAIGSALFVFATAAIALLSESYIRPAVSNARPWDIVLVSDAREIPVPPDKRLMLPKKEIPGNPSEAPDANRTLPRGERLLTEIVNQLAKKPVIVIQSSRERLTTEIVVARYIQESLGVSPIYVICCGDN